MTRKTRVGLIVAAVVVAVVAGLGVLAYSSLWSEEGPRLPTEAEVEATTAPDDLPKLVMLAPGTVLGTDPPKGWSDPIVKTITHVESGDVDTLPAFARKTAARFRTVVLADVRRRGESGPYSLRRVGAGLALEIDHKETVISSATHKAQGANLGTIDAMVLIRAEKALGRSRLAARTETFTLYDTFVELADAHGVHHPILLRYALVLDPATGSIRAAYWTMPEAAADRLPVESLILLPKNAVFLCGIHIAAKRVIGPVARSWGFAMVELPKGESVPATSTLRALANRDDLEKDSETLEKAVREALGDRQPPK